MVKKNKPLVYSTRLSDDKEYQFRNWWKYASGITGQNPNPDDPRHAYDLRAYYNENPYDIVFPNQHFPDTYKEPTHESFSVESVKAMDFPQVAGSWSKTPGPVEISTDTFSKADLSDITLRKRQAYAESRFNPNAISHKGAKGLYQIMPDVLSDYVKATGNIDDLEDSNYSEKIRNWKMNQLLKTKAVSGTDENGEVNSLVKLVKQYAAYNWGEGNLGKFLLKKKESGIDIYHSLDWVEDLPKETRDYVTFVVFGRDTTSNHESDFQKAIKTHINPTIKQMGGLIYKPMYKYNVEIERPKPKIDVVDNSNERFPITNVDVKPVVIPQFKDVVEVPVVTRGKTQYKTDDIDPGNLSEFLAKLEDSGISVRVTSGRRPGAKTSNGHISRHASADAIDITPIEGQTYADLIQQIKNNPDLIAYMQDNGIGILDETNPIVKQRTGATGDHWHISRGYERNAILGRDLLLS